PAASTRFSPLSLHDALPISQPVTCDYCRGHGQVVQSQGFFRVQTTCPACRGVGKIVRDKCEDCSGSGRTLKQVTLEVKVPAGVRSEVHTSELQSRENLVCRL